MHRRRILAWTLGKIVVERQMRGRTVELWHETGISRLSDKMIGRLL